MRSPFREPLWHDQHPDFLRLDASLPPDHPARWLAHVVAQLDLTALRLSYAGSGSLAFPPHLLLAFVLFMYAQGLLSPAQWHNRVLYDDQAKWLLRGHQPTRARLYAFRDRTAPFLDDFHQQLLTWAVRDGVTSASRGSLDGTFVAALASRHQLFSPRRLDQRLLLLRLLVWCDGAADQADLGTLLQTLPELVLTTLGLWLELLRWGGSVASLADTVMRLLALLELLAAAAGPSWPPQLPAWVPHSVVGRCRVLGRYEAAQQRLTARLQPYQHKAKLSKKDQQTIKYLKVSVTDPEAALGWDKVGTFRPLYNVLLVQATDAPLTLSWDVLARNNDDGLLKPMMEKTKKQLGHHLQEALVDGAFVSVGEVAWCEQEGITVYAPPRRAEVVRAAVAQADRAQSAASTAALPAVAPGPQGPGQEVKLPKEAFRYDSAEQVYYCPQGKRLAAAYRTTEKRQNGLELPVIVHRAAGQDCQGCAQQAGCTSNPKKGRVVKRYEGEETLARLEQRMAEPASQAVYKQRCQSVELGYADLKEHRGLRSFRCFGKQRARAQAGLVILASNGLNLMRALHRRQDAAPHPPVPEKQPA